MRIVVGCLFLLIIAIVAAALIWYILSTRNRQTSAPDKCKHTRWTKWKTEQIQTVHLYAEVDEGRQLPDRVDSYMTRECLKCGIPEARTVRGIDSPHYK